jgi:hypothetical protein
MTNNNKTPIIIGSVVAGIVVLGGAVGFGLGVFSQPKKEINKPVTTSSTASIITTNSQSTEQRVMEQRMMESMIKKQMEERRINSAVPPINRLPTNSMMKPVGPKSDKELSEMMMIKPAQGIDTPEAIKTPTESVPSKMGAMESINQ